LQDNELTILFKEEIDASNEIDKVVAKIEELGGKMVKIENEGVKRLAYDIQDRSKANHVFMNIQIPKDNVAKLSNWINIQDSVLRYLLVRCDERRRRG
jgi:small subunit ribosomal protein S6